MNKLNKIVWVLVALGIFLMIFSYIHDYIIESDDMFRGFTLIILFFITALLTIFNLAYTNKQLDNKATYPTTKKSSIFKPVVITLSVILFIILLCTLIIFSAYH